MEKLYLYHFVKNEDMSEEYNDPTHFLYVSTIEYWESYKCLQDHDDGGLYDALNRIGIVDECMECMFEIYDLDEAQNALEDEERFTTNPDFSLFVEGNEES